MSTVLVVDDEPFILKIVSAVLDDLGFEQTYTAPDAETALALAQRHKPDMVITDVKLPGMNGVELARRIKASTQIGSTPIVLMSAYGEPSPNPGDGFLRKPFDIDQLAQTIQLYVRNSH